MVLDIQDIINSVTVPVLIKDDFIRTGKFLKLKNGDVEAYVGGFSIVFPVQIKGEKWAFRCWHRTLDDSLERIKYLSKEFKKAQLPYLLNYDFIQTGITIAGNNYPTTRMKWIEGLTIKEYLCEHYQSKDKLLYLAEQFLRLVKDMHLHSFAHGDLQHGNIIVNTQEDLFLIDYDSFYCPHFKGEKDIITGLKDYQHPARKVNKYTSEKIDYFSELIIYISILGIAYNPSLSSKYKVEDSEHMLFESDDFENIRHSSIYNDLINLNPIFQVLLNILEIYLSKHSIDELEPFDLLLERKTKAPDINYFASSPSNNLYVGDKIKLSWNVDGADKIYINSKRVNKNSCERTLAIIGNNSFTLKAENSFKKNSKSLVLIARSTPKILFISSKNTLLKNSSEETIISWNVTNSTKVFLCYDGLTEEVKNIGQKSFSPSRTTKYILRVIGLDEKRIFEEEIIVSVYPKAIVSFTSDKKTVLSKSAIKLSWHVENAEKIEFKDEGMVSSNGSKTMFPETATTYSLIVTDHFGKQEYKLPISTLPLPIIKLIASKNKINRDKAEKVNISWDVQHSSNVSITILGIVQSVESKGCREIQLNETTEVILRCLALDNNKFYEKKISINVYSEAKINFHSDKKYTIPEVPIQISWDVKNAKHVELKGYGKVSTQGNKEIYVQDETIFTLIVTDEFSVKEKEITVKMLPLPIIKTINVPFPKFNNPLNITINLPIPKIGIKVPFIHLPEVDFRIPDMPKMDSIYEKIAKKTCLNIYNLFKSIVSHLINR